VTKEKKKVIDCLENPHFQSMITLNPNETNLHVIPMGKLNPKVVAVFFITEGLSHYLKLLLAF
jgi:hypothetical protein